MATYERKSSDAKQGGENSPKRQNNLTERKVMKDPNKPLTYKQRKSFSKNKALRAEQSSKSFKPQYKKDNTAPERNDSHVSSNLETGNWKSSSNPKRSFTKPGASRTWSKPSDKPRWDKKTNDFKSPMSQTASRDFKGPRKEYSPKQEGQRDFKGPRKDFSSKRDFNAPRKDNVPKSEVNKRDFSAPKTDRREVFVKTEKKKVDKSKFFKYGNNK